MKRWLVLLAIALVTWLGLSLRERGYFRSAWRSVNESEQRLRAWEPAAQHPAGDRPEDAFQRAWNSSERRVRRALDANPGSD